MSKEGDSESSQASIEETTTAWTKRDLNHVMRVSTEAMKEKDNSVKRQKLDDTLCRKVMTSAQNTIRVVAEFHYHLAEAESQMNSKDMAKARQAIRLAEAKAEESSTPYFCHQIEKLKTEWKLSLIYQLPDELLLQIFKNFGPADLVRCYNVNISWKNILSSILSSKTLCLRGDIDTIDKQWVHVHKTMKISPIRSLSVIFEGLDFDSNADDYRFDLLFSACSCEVEALHETTIKEEWHRSHFRKTFPYDMLEKVSYNTDFIIMDALFWTTLTKCTNLKSLTWDYSYDESAIKAYKNHENAGNRKPNNFKVKGTPLSDCKLDKIKIHYPVPFKIQKEFAAIVRKAKFKSIRLAPLVGVSSGESEESESEEETNSKASSD